MVKRNYGIDLLRCVSMLMVVTLHFLGHGGVLKTAAVGSGTYKTAWLIEIICYCAVNCYALISGYVGVKGNYRFRNLVSLWLQVAFYSLGITLLFSLFGQDPVTTKQWFSSVFPVSHKFYWYFGAYFAMSFFIPLLSRGINALTHSEAKRVCLLLILAFPLLRTVLCFNFMNTFAGSDIFLLNGGYSALWLMILYVIGGCIGKFDLLKDLHAVWLWLIVAASVWLSLGFKLYMESAAATEELKKMVGSGAFISYVSPTIVAMSVALLELFSRINNLPKFIEKVITFFGGASFAAYLIQEHPLFRKYFITNQYLHLAKLNPLEFLLKLGVTVLLFYIGCCVIDNIRIWLFKLLHIKPLLNRICDGKKQPNK